MTKDKASGSKIRKSAKTAKLSFEQLVFAMEISARADQIENNKSQSAFACALDAFCFGRDARPDAQAAASVIDWAGASGASIALFEDCDAFGTPVHLLFQCLKSPGGSIVAEALRKAGFPLLRSFDWGPPELAVSGNLLNAVCYYAESFAPAELVESCAWLAKVCPDFLNARDSQGYAPLGRLNALLRSTGQNSCLEGAKALLGLGADPYGICLNPVDEACPELKSLVTARQEKLKLANTLRAGPQDNAGLRFSKPSSL